MYDDPIFNNSLKNTAYAIHQWRISYISSLFFWICKINRKFKRKKLAATAYSADYPTYRDTLEGGEVESPNEPSLPLGLPKDFNITENDKNAPGWKSLGAQPSISLLFGR